MSKKPDIERLARAVFMVIRSIEGCADISGSDIGREEAECVSRSTLGPRWHRRPELTSQQNDDFLFVSAHWPMVKTLLGDAVLSRLASGRRMRGMRGRMARAAAYLNWFVPVYDVRVTVRLTQEQARKLGPDRSAKIRNIIEKN